MEIRFPFSNPDAATIDEPPMLHDGQYASIEFEKPPRRRKRHPIGFAVPAEPKPNRARKQRRR